MSQFIKCSEIHPRQHLRVGGAAAQVCFVGSWMSGRGVCERSTVQACSAILCISLTSLALNGARTRGQGLGAPG